MVFLKSTCSKIGKLLVTPIFHLSVCAEQQKSWSKGDGVTGRRLGACHPPSSPWALVYLTAHSLRLHVAQGMDGLDAFSFFSLTLVSPYS